jgi:hypothetical protein
MKNIVSLMMVGLLLTGCGSVSKELGLERQPIDEFQITTRAPLAIPPEYTLRPPVPGAPRPQEEMTRSIASRAVLGMDQPNPAELTNLSKENLSAGEVQFLEKSGGFEADPNIREMLTVEYESLNQTEEKQGYLEFLNPFSRTTPSQDVIDPAAEQERLQNQIPDQSVDPETPETAS